MNIFLAGAAGAIGRRLVPLLRAAGHQVTGTTRDPDRAVALSAAGVTPVIVDVYDAAWLSLAVRAAGPDVVINQLTDLPQKIDPETYPAALAANARVRIEGTPNLVTAAREAGVPRFIAQSVAFAYAPGSEPYREGDPLDTAAEGSRASLVKGVMAVEGATTRTPGVTGVVLRYGRFYGPGTWYDAPEGRGAVHIDAAAHATLLALTKGAPGIYNIADDDGMVSIEKARRELGFDPAFRIKGH